MEPDYLAKRLIKKLKESGWSISDSEAAQLIDVFNKIADELWNESYVTHDDRQISLDL